MGPSAIKLSHWRDTTRLVETCYPPIDVFAHLSDDHEENVALWELEGRTNPRFQAEKWGLGLVKPEDFVSGAPGAAIVMAAVMYAGGDNISRFSDGTFGAYYAGKETETSLREFAFHAGRYRKAHSLAPESVETRAWLARPIKPLHDVRGKQYKHLHDPDPDNYSHSAGFARTLRENNAWGVVYNSVRHKGGEYIAVFRPPALTTPRQGTLYEFNYDGTRITEVCEKKGPLLTF